MATDYENLRVELRGIARWIIPYASTFSAIGTTAYGIDTTLFSDPNDLKFTPDDLNNHWLFRMDAAAAGDRERRIGGNSGVPLDLDTGRIYPAVVYTNAPAGAEQYEIWSPRVRPQDAFDLLKARLRRFWVPTYGPCAGINDEDMEDSGTTNWTVAGGGSVAKVETAGNVLTGKQALFYNAGSSAQYIEGPTYRVREGRAYETGCSFRVIGGPVGFVMYDKTNSAEIGSRAESSHVGFTAVQKTITVPTGCEEIAPRWYVTNDSDDVYIDNFIKPRGISEGFVDGPTWLDNPLKVRRVMIARYRDAVGTDLYDARSLYFERDLIRGQEYYPRTTPQHTNKNRIELVNGVTVSGEVWVEALRRASDTYALVFTAAGETAPSLDLDQRLVAIDWAMAICDYVLSAEPGYPPALETQNRYASEHAALMSDHEKSLTTPPLRPSAGVRNMTRV